MSLDLSRPRRLFFVGLGGIGMSALARYLQARGHHVAGSDQRDSPLLAELRAEMGLDPDPVAAYKRSGYFERVAAERVGGRAAGWGA